MDHPTQMVSVYCNAFVQVRDEKVLEVLASRIDPEFAKNFYDIDSLQKIYEHLAGNAVANGVTDASILEGFADLERGDVTMWVSDVEPELLPTISDPPKPT